MQNSVVEQIRATKLLKHMMTNPSAEVILCFATQKNPTVDKDVFFLMLFINDKESFYVLK
jgi:hypothetical protein